MRVAFIEYIFVNLYEMRRTCLLNQFVPFPLFFQPSAMSSGLTEVSLRDISVVLINVICGSGQFKVIVVYFMEYKTYHSLRFYDKIICFPFTFEIV